MYAFQKYNITAKWLEALIAMWRKLILDVWEIFAATVQVICCCAICIAFPILFTKHEHIYIKSIKVLYTSLFIIIAKIIMLICGIVGFLVLPLIYLLSDFLPPFQFVSQLLCGTSENIELSVNEVMTEDFAMSIARVISCAPLMIVGFALICNQEISYLKSASYFCLLLLSLPMVRFSAQIGNWLDQLQVKYAVPLKLNFLRIDKV